MVLSILIVIMIFVLMLIFASLQKNDDTNITKSFWEKFQTMFIEDPADGLWSSNRIAFIFTMFLSNIIMWGGILYLIIINLAFPAIPESIIVIYGISNGVASVAKVWQKREERMLEQIESSERINQATLDSSDTQNKNK